MDVVGELMGMDEIGSVGVQSDIRVRLENAVAHDDLVPDGGGPREDLTLFGLFERECVEGEQRVVEVERRSRNAQKSAPTPKIKSNESGSIWPKVSSIQRLKSLPREQS